MVVFLDVCDLMKTKRKMFSKIQKVYDKDTLLRTNNSRAEGVHRCLGTESNLTNNWTGCRYDPSRTSGLIRRIGWSLEFTKLFG